MDRRRELWEARQEQGRQGGDLPGAGGRLPVGTEAVLVVGGPRWARRHRRALSRVRVVLRVGGAALAALVWVGVLAMLTVVATGHGALLVPDEGTKAYGAVHRLAVLFALVVVGGALGHGQVLARSNRRAARARRAVARRRRPTEVRFTFVDCMNLPDNPDLVDDPNGFTGTGTQAPGVTDPGVYS